MIDADLLENLYNDRKKEIEELLNPNPSRVKPIVTQGDVKKTYITRYFVRPVNDVTFVSEISKNQYETLKTNPRFISVSIKWKIVGKKETKAYPTGVNIYGVADLNRIEVANADLKFGGLKNYIGDYLEFWFSE